MTSNINPAEWGSLKHLVERYKADAEKDAKFAKRLTGFDNLDGRGKFKKDGQKQMFSPGIYIIGAPPSAGKTTFCLQLCTQLADLGEEVLFLTYEMADKNLLRKLTAHNLFEKKRNGRNVTALTAAGVRRSGLDNEDVVAALDEIAETMTHLKILESGWTAEKLIGKLNEFKTAVERSPVICIDYLQLIPSEKETTAKENLDKLLAELRTFQKDTDSTLILISSLNRQNLLAADKRISLSSLKETGMLEYTADTVWALEPPDNNKDNREEKVRAMKLRCLKNREGELYEVYFRYHAAHDTFEPCTKEDLDIDESESRTKSR